MLPRPCQFPILMVRSEMRLPYLPVLTMMHSLRILRNQKMVSSLNKTVKMIHLHRLGSMMKMLQRRKKRLQMSMLTSPSYSRPTTRRVPMAIMMRVCPSLLSLLVHFHVCWCYRLSLACSFTESATVVTTTGMAELRMMEPRLFPCQ